MKNALIIIKNNFLRIGERKNYLIIMVIVTTLTLLFAVYFTSKFEVKGNIAVVTNSTQIKAADSKYLKVSILKELPPKSLLVMNKYDAVIIDEGNGEFKIQSIKSDDFNQKVLQALTNKGTVGFDKEVNRGIGSNILGYLIMFLLLQGATYMMLFSEDKEYRIIKRVISSPVSVGTYLFSHAVTNFLLILIPTFIIICISKALLGVNVGFGYFQYFAFLSLMTLLATSFALFMSSITKKADNSVMATSAIAVLSSILAGSFGKIGNHSTVMKNVLNILPQKNYLSIVQGIEQGKGLSEFAPQLIYYFTFCILLIVASVVITNKKIIRGED